MSIAEMIKREARALGFDAVGISRIDSSGQPPIEPPSSLPPDLDSSLPYRLFSHLTEWLRLGYYGTMAWMTRDPNRRSDPKLVLPGCRSVVSVGMNYYTDNRANEQPGMGRIARYAWGKDYHTVMSRRLAQLEAKIATLAPGVTTRAYVDTGPIMEKAWAQQAGLGWIGKHSNLVSAECGSWLLLGEILTTLDLEPDEPATDLCGSCTLCIQACPTGAMQQREKDGIVWVVQDGARRPEYFWNGTAEVMIAGNAGLTGMAVDPHYAENHFVYFAYVCDPDTDGVDTGSPAFGRVVRFKTAAWDSNIVDPSTKKVLIGRGWADGIPTGHLDHLPGVSGRVTRGRD